MVQGVFRPSSAFDIRHKKEKHLPAGTTPADEADGAAEELRKNATLRALRRAIELEKNAQPVPTLRGPLCR